jgi:hypothetical protein
MNYKEIRSVAAKLQELRDQCLIQSISGGNEGRRQRYPSLTDDEYKMKKFGVVDPGTVRVGPPEAVAPSGIRFACAHIADLACSMLRAEGYLVENIFIRSCDMTSKSATAFARMSKDHFGRFINAIVNEDADVIKSFEEQMNFVTDNPAGTGTHALLEITIDSKLHLVDPTVGLIYKEGLQAVQQNLTGLVYPSWKFLDQYKYIKKSYHLDNPYFHLSATLPCWKSVRSVHYVVNFGSQYTNYKF